jgi:hypothetical protein
MDFAPPPAPGPRMQEVGDRLIVFFRPRRSWGTLVFLTVWLLGWTAGGLFAAAQLPTASSGEAAFLLFWLCGWVLGECTVVGVISWRLFGRESLAVTREELEVRRCIGRFASVKRYDAARVRDIKAARVPHDQDQSSRKDYCLEISYDDETVRVAEGMGEREAEYVASIIFSRLLWRSWWNDEDQVRPRTEESAPRQAASLRAGHFQIHEPDPKRTFLLVGGALMACVAIAGASLVTVFGHHAAPRPAQTAAETQQPLPSSWKDSTNARGYASAMTAGALNAGPSTMVGRPHCDAGATWTHWSCSALASSYWPVKTAGLAVPYRCESVSTGGVKCGLAAPLGPIADGP